VLESRLCAWCMRVVGKTSRSAALPPSLNFVTGGCREFTCPCIRSHAPHQQPSFVMDVSLSRYPSWEFLIVYVCYCCYKYRRYKQGRHKDRTSTAMCGTHESCLTSESAIKLWRPTYEHHTHNTHSLCNTCLSQQEHHIQRLALQCGDGTFHGFITGSTATAWRNN
jgi:hypothetical protein